MKYNMNNIPKIQIISGWEREIWIIFWKWYEEKKAIYSYYLSMYIWPFLRKFWYKPEDSAWDESYLVFQSLLLNSFYYKNFDETALKEKWFEIIGKKQIWVKFSSDKMIAIQEISWDNFDIQEYLQKAKLAELYFWFVPLNNNSNILIFAKKSVIEVDFSPKIQEVLDL